MAGTPLGGQQAAETNKKKYGADFYTKIGTKGGRTSKGSWLQTTPGAASKLGKKGGAKSRLGYKLIREDKTYLYYVHKETNVPMKLKKSTVL